MKSKAKNKAFFILGFNNWGKTRLLTKLFNTGSFRDKLYQIENIKDVNFIVQQNSNDDYGAKKFIESTKEKIRANSNEPKNLFAALCPTVELEDDSVKIDSVKILKSCFEDWELHFFYLKNKWDDHAELSINKIRDLYKKEFPNSQHYPIDALGSDVESKLKEIKKQLAIIFTNN